VDLCGEGNADTKHQYLDTPFDREHKESILLCFLKMVSSSQNGRHTGHAVDSTNTVCLYEPLC
jgi:hypothetical protein